MVTRSFVVDESNTPEPDPYDDTEELVNSMFETDSCDLESIDSYKPKKSLTPVPASRSPSKVTKHFNDPKLQLTQTFSSLVIFTQNEWSKRGLGNNDCRIWKVHGPCISIPRRCRFILSRKFFTFSHTSPCLLWSLNAQFQKA